MKAIFGEETACFEGQIIKRECIFLWGKNPTNKQEKKENRVTQTKREFSLNHVLCILIQSIMNVGNLFH